MAVEGWRKVGLEGGWVHLRRVDADELPCHVRTGDMQAGVVRDWF